jgi:hypothetical protein
MDWLVTFQHVYTRWFVRYATSTYCSHSVQSLQAGLHGEGCTYQQLLCWPVRPTVRHMMHLCGWRHLTSSSAVSFAFAVPFTLCT